ncbi:MFS transporter [Brachybacterium saurashtrense]|uniref:NarK/NasA family nitrate transporter n=1 Tax=Brachybacterium saurashtrense TaxID=556288 RepID=A0A345YN52_9MICO|nr:MFS transporter [Brachybacterium saurashtrense]AXK45354.1 NarK/NasA family nitrate transporter [Brachybacterium saurashtrense]RRR21889.1 NarK/NasA family nitrate transporter [Brachybacterium saurashtrense]
MTVTPSRTTTASSDTVPAGAWRALLLVTVGFGINFWAWALLSPLGPIYVERGLSADASLIVAIPVLVGSLGRIVMGALTDRFGGHLMFPLVSVLTVIPVLFLGFVGQYTYPTLLVGGFFLGIAGTTFAIGVPYVNSWFPPAKRGMATGLYGVGMGGTAISAFTTVPLLTGIGDVAPFVATAAALIAFAVVGRLFMRPAPTWQPARRSIVAQSAAVMRLTVTWQACYLYALSFGGYVAFSVFLPTMLQNWYGLETADASFRMAGFVIVAVIMRPLGGTLSDSLGASRTLLLSYTAVAAAALVLAFQPALMPLGTIAFIVMAAGLGLGSGAVFALVAQTSEPSVVGSVTGFVGAAGGLGGFVPPLVMAAIHASSGSYSLGIVLLLLATLGAVGVTLFVARGARTAAAGS